MQELFNTYLLALSALEAEQSKENVEAAYSAHSEFRLAFTASARSMQALHTEYQQQASREAELARKARATASAIASLDADELAKLVREATRAMAGK